MVTRSARGANGGLPFGKCLASGLRSSAAALHVTRSADLHITLFFSRRRCAGVSLIREPFCRNRSRTHTEENEPSARDILRGVLQANVGEST